MNIKKPTRQPIFITLLVGALATGAFAFTLPEATASPHHRLTPHHITHRTVHTRVTDRTRTVAIAGLKKDQAAGTEDAVPTLGKLPFLGKLFRNKKNKQKRNLQVLVTPRITKTND